MQERSDMDVQETQADNQAKVDEAKQERKRKRANARRRQRDQIMRDMGLTKVRGAVSGRVYWE